VKSAIYPSVVGHKIADIVSAVGKNVNNLTKRNGRQNTIVESGAVVSKDVPDNPIVGSMPVKINKQIK
jgi:hypothetical protein